ncbi:23S rRNA (pseudouridine(1915)-N(3))-methyltransferase RlmH [Rhodovulum sp. 12E13]|uniref:23S rRNA (pseudouridine(1915)-N(3))-methyltransferase RlmH n=1 Tax=Rhodovulum sp. 12E13 TaxID=2203891 RepID=UPI000E15E18A|nr:23S rRNA (pseudouridine(1915)-N(3))-methyltransferase RlmH [Rhodovulum sp. 12E13]RDC74912.1 23S rRNA (pseudouridine(1915)-N(3))-methyltransferase RlmH [Rhodovulum sp. 12E13]
MRLTLVAVGRTRTGPERELVADYLTRAAKTGRAVGLTEVRLAEVEPRGRGGPEAEAEALRRAIPDGAVLVCLDERGRQLSSPDLAETIAGWRDGGHRGAAFLIGGADGLDPALVAGADLSLSLGRMVWPHLLARVMVAEQLYRAASILAGAPYHRG